MGEAAFQRCINSSCGRTFGIAEVHHRCPACGELLDVAYDWSRFEVPGKLSFFESKWERRAEKLAFSGVWRFGELLPFAPADLRVTIGEGQTLLRPCPSAAGHAGMSAESLFLQYEGMNPSGSFKDNGMAGAFTHARMAGATVAACASTGNTSASMAAFAAATGALRAVIFVGGGKIALGKLSQALDYGGRTFEIRGDFDDAMARVQEVSVQRGIYLMNSLNPFRLEGQKAIMYRILEALRWEVPDWIVVPGGNLGNSSSFGKAYMELLELGLVRRVPRICIVNASGADTLYRLVNDEGLRWNGSQYERTKVKTFYDRMTAEGRAAHTIASAIEINRPVNLSKALRALDVMSGVVLRATDEEILDAKAAIARGGLGCEPASAATVAGLRKLVEAGTVSRSDRVVCVLTGHQLKDPNATVGYHSREGADREKLRKYGVERTPLANSPVPVGNSLEEILKALDKMEE
jgi:threonine synthase